MSPCPPAHDAIERFPKLAALIEYLDGLTGRADLRVLERLLATTEVTPHDLSPACHFGEAGYRRNTISRTDHYELLALCWRSGDCTPIHDHQGVSCAFKVVEGSGTEIRFSVTGSGLVCPVATTTMPPGYICAADDADIHLVANMQPRGRDLVTMHIYSPPIQQMNTYRFAKATVVESGLCVGVGDGI
ncbi:MAG: cysteine dioxygenase [Phycisphaerales bacterium]